MWSVVDSGPVMRLTEQGNDELVESKGGSQIFQAISIRDSNGEGEAREATHHVELTQDEVHDTGRRYATDMQNSVIEAMVTLLSLDVSGFYSFCGSSNSVVQLMIHTPSAITPRTV